jgi:hypothetical protein
MSEFRVDQITNQSGTAGPDIAGITTFSSTSGMLMPSGVTEYRGGRDRGIFAGGTPSTNIIEYVTISTLGNSSDFGDLSIARRLGSSVSSSINLYVYGGFSHSKTQAVSFTSGGSRIEFDSSYEKYGSSASSNSIRGVFLGGNFSPVSQYNQKGVVIKEFASGSERFDFKLNCPVNTLYGSMNISSPSRGVFVGVSPSIKTTLSIEFATLGEVNEFGDLVFARRAVGGASDGTRGICAGGGFGGLYSDIDYFSISSGGIAQDFGDLTVARCFLNSANNKTRATFASGSTDGSGLTTQVNTIDYITIQTTGNATDFGDVSIPVQQGCGGSNCHGGLGD